MDAAQAMERAHRARLQARSPERAKLAECIDKLRKMEAHAKAVDRAREDNFHARVAARKLVENADSKIEEAKKAAAEFEVAKALGKSGDAPRLLKDIRADVQAAKDELAALEEADKVLAKEADAARNRIQYVERDRDQAVTFVVKNAAETKKLKADFESMHANYENARRVMRLIGPMLDREYYHRADTFWSDGWRDLPAARIWAKAIEALHENADAPLPGHFGLG